MRKKLTLTLEENIIMDLKIYTLKHGNNNVSRLIEQLVTDFLEKEKKEMEANELGNWTEKRYTVIEQHHDYDLHKFEVIQRDEVIGTIYPDDLDQQNQIIEDLNNHKDVNGWETNDGDGGEIELTMSDEERADAAREAIEYFSKAAGVDAGTAYFEIMDLLDKYEETGELSKWDYDNWSKTMLKDSRIKKYKGNLENILAGKNTARDYLNQR